MISLKEIVKSTNEKYEKMFYNFIKDNPDVYQFAKMVDMTLTNFLGDAEVWETDSGNFIVKYYEMDNPSKYPMFSEFSDKPIILLIGILSNNNKINRKDVPEIKELYNKLIDKFEDGFNLLTSPNKVSMKMLDSIIGQAKKRGINLKVTELDKLDYGDSDFLKYKTIFVEKI